ncbi:protein draper-like [Mytilus californianus]|uniref:protein draper-like n=1 Tax=Mytilus californianus TaxID=6549 RepID=UPI0022471700|nr:protein draper-like [Mytilus californianus]
MIIMYIDLFFMFVYVDRIITLKIGDPHVCPKPVKISNPSETQKELDIECCPHYIYQNRKCEACPRGKFGQDCSLSCLRNYYGVQCKQMCSCTGNTKCDPINGCVCYEGYTGKHCIDVCQPGRYGVNCNEECFCAQDAKCDQVTGVCLCPAGWFGVHCTKECPFGKFGKDCNGTCDCSDGVSCDIITGECIEKEDPNSDGDINESKGTIMIYIMMAAAVIGLVCVVTMILKAKEALCRNVQKPKKNTTKPKIKRRKAQQRSSTYRDNAQTGSFIIETEVSVLQLPFEDEDLYCEIEDINVTEPGRY